MKHGIIVQFRLNTEDVMSCVDVLNMSNVSKEGMSLSMLCKLVLSSYLHRMRTDAVIPTRDGFEYLSMVAPFINVSQAKKSSLANTLPSYGAQQQSAIKPNVHVQAQQHIKRDEDEFKTHDADMIRKRALVELAVDELTQREIIEGENFSQEQHAQLIKLHAALVQLNNDVDVDVRELLA